MKIILTITPALLIALLLSLSIYNREYVSEFIQAHKFITVLSLFPGLLVLFGFLRGK